MASEYATVAQQQTRGAMRADSEVSDGGSVGGGPGGGGAADADAVEIGEALDAIGFGWAQVKIIAVAGLLLSADAMEMMLLSFIGPAVRCEWGVSHEEEALLTTVVFLGMLIGAYACGVVADRFGRRFALKVLATVTLVLGVLSAGVPSFGYLLLIRALMGVALGGSSIGFAYVMEFLPTEHRGRWGVLLELFWVLGTFVEVTMAWIIYDTRESRGAWRMLLLLTSIPVGLGAVFFLANCVPASPRFLSASGNPEEAMRVLVKMGEDNGRPLRAGGHLRVHTTNAAHKSSGNPFAVMPVLREVFSPSLRVVTIFMWFIWFTNAFSYYGVVLLTTSLAVVEEESANITIVNGTVSEEYANGGGGDDDFLICDPITRSPFEGSSAFTEVFIATLSELPGTLVAAYIVDALGRKLSQGICFGGAAVALVVMFFAGGSSLMDTSCIFLARALIMASFAITYVYTPEVYPTYIRTTASGLANSFSRLGGMLAPFVGQDLVERGRRDLAILVLALFASLACLAALMLPVETAGRGLVDNIEDECEIQLSSLDRPIEPSENGGLSPPRRGPDDPPLAAESLTLS